MIRPHWRARMPGRTRSVMAMTLSTMELNCARQSAMSWPAAGVGGGPPVLLTRMSTGPSSASMRATWRSIAARSARSHSRAQLRAPRPRTSSCAAASEDAERPARATLAPSRASAAAMARPSPPLPPSTSAVLPAMPRSIWPLLFVSGHPVRAAARSAAAQTRDRVQKSGWRSRICIAAHFAPQCVRDDALGRPLAVPRRMPQFPGDKKSR